MHLMSASDLRMVAGESPSSAPISVFTSAATSTISTASATLIAPFAMRPWIRLSTIKSEACPNGSGSVGDAQALSLSAPSLAGSSLIGCCFLSKALRFRLSHTAKSGEMRALDNSLIVQSHHLR